MPVTFYEKVAGKWNRVIQSWRVLEDGVNLYLRKRGCYSPESSQHYPLPYFSHLLPYPSP